MPDAFELLGLEARFDLTAEEVRAAFLSRVAGTGGSHPDAGGGEEAAARLNAAKVAVGDPETRANLLLTRFGGPSKEINRELPEGFLIKVMEAREGLEEAARRRDSAGIDRWRVWAEGERTGHISRVGALFAEAAASKPTGVGLAAIRRELNAWRYVERMLEQIGEL